MGFSVTAAHVIFAFALLTAFSAATGTYWKTAADVDEGRRTQAQRAVAQAQTNITITGTPVYDAGAQTYTFDVDNVGSEVLEHAAFQYLLDGVVHLDMAADYPHLNGGPTTSGLFLPGDVLTVRLANVTSPPTKLKVTTDNAISAYHP